MDEQRKAWSLRIEEATSLDDLDDVAAGLADVEESWKGPLMWKVSDRRRKLLVKEKHLSAGWAGAAAFANSYGLPAPDGRRLYAYRLNADEFERLQLELASKGPLAALAKGHVPGLFALWASEWFRRNYDGGGYSWDKLLKPLGLTGSGQTEQTELRKITSLGLGQWQRTVLRFESARGYLCSLAREGGFPTAAVAEGGGWARPVLEAIIAPLLGDSAAGEDRALAIAAAQRHRLPVSFRDDDFVQLCADLAVAIVDLRREATQPAAAAGLPILAWLDLNRPDWRDVLPITTGDCTADSLIDGLMSVEGISGTSVGVERLLARGEDGVWREAARISLDGDIDSQTMRAISGDPGRLRVFASEELARHLPGELAMLEPPAIGSKQWTARSTRLVRGVQHIPFSASLMLELRVGARNLARVQLPGGKPRRGQLLVAQAESGDEDAPSLLRIVGSGSGQYRTQSLFLQMPRGWQVQTTVDEQAVLLGSGAGETDLWRVTGGAFVIDDSGDRYRIRCGQPADIATRIDLVGDRCPWAEVSGDVDLFNGAPHVGMRGMTGQLCLRQPGTRSWRPAPTPLPVGHYELGWRLDNILLDRRTIAVLPEGAEFTCHRSGPEITYTVEGFGEVDLAPSADAPVIANAALHIWRPRPVHSRVYRFEATLTWPEGPPLGVGIQFPCEATIARWDGSVLPHGSTFTLEDLRDLVGIDGGRMELHAELREPRVGKCAQMVWEFDRELPLASIKGDLASLLLPGSIDAVVLLDMHDGINTNWYVKPFALTLRNEGGVFVSSEAIADPDVEFCGRSLADPVTETCFGGYSLLTDASHHPLRLPDSAGGPWLVYLRRGNSVLTRPAYTVGYALAPVPQTPLANAMAQSPGSMLDTALHEYLRVAGGEDEAARLLVNELIDLVVALRGLPPATFRVLALLDEYPEVLARMAFLAAEDYLDAIVALADALPFAWCTLPLLAWEHGQRAVFDHTFRQLAALEPASQIKFSAEALQLRRRAIVEREPLLAAAFDAPSTEPIADIAQRFANRAIQRLRSDSINRYRSLLTDRLPTAFTVFDPGFVDTFDAPCAAALAATGAWRPDGTSVRHIKTVARTFPSYFAEAYACWLKESR